MKTGFLFKLSFFLFACTCVQRLQAQQTDSSKTAEVPQKDLIDLLHAFAKNKSATMDSNQHGANDHAHLSVVPSVGYSLQNGFAGSLSANASFLNSSSEIQNMSVMNSIVTVTQKKQFTLASQSNLWTKENKLNLVGDYRFLIYPQSTFGLGGHTKLSDENLVNYNLLRLSQSVYFKLKKDLYAGIGYALNYHYKISETAKTQQADADILNYDELDFNNTATVSQSTVPNYSHTVSSGLGLNLLYDRRRNPNNPVAGAKYFNVQLLNNLKFLGSDDNWQSLVVDTRKYIGVGKQNKLALWTYGWFTFNNHAPYLDLPSTGWDANGNLGRGYVQGRFRGKNLLYAEAEYRMNFTRNGLLGGVLFSNAQSVSDWPSNRFTTLHPAFGTGLRLKFNKLAGTNIALDYAVGTDGSKGVFVNLGEVF